MSTLTTLTTPMLNDDQPNKVQSGRDDEAVEAGLDLLTTNYSEKNKQDAKNRLIQELFEEGFEVKNPKGTRKIGSKKLYQAMWRTANRMKPLDFTIHGTGRPEWAEKLVTEGVGTVMTKGGYDSSLRDKGGAFQGLLMYGDKHIHVGTSEDGDVIKFRPVSDGNVYVDAYATAMRSASGSGEASECCVIFSYPWKKAIALYPILKKKGGKGEIPRNKLDRKELERSYEQENELEDLVEVAHYYNLSEKIYCVFAGTECTVIKKETGEKYPFMMDAQPYIPVLQYSCMPSSEGYWNHGLGAMIYDLAVISRRLLNMEVNHLEDNVYPITMVSTPRGKAGEFFQKLGIAHEMRAAGKKGYVAMESDPNSPGSNAVSAQSLLTQNLVNEWQLVYDMLDRELKRMGIFLDEADRGTDVTATQVMAEEESSNAFVKQIMEYNATTSRFAVELTLDMIKRFVTKGNKTPLNLTTTIEFEGTKVRPDFVTLGMVKDELAKHNYFVKVNARTGAIPSNILQQAQVTRVMQMTQPGTPAYFKLWEQFARLNDRDLSMEDAGGGQPQGNQGAPEGGDMLPIPSETDRLGINPRQTQQQIA